MDVLSRSIRYLQNRLPLAAFLLAEETLQRGGSPLEESRAHHIKSVAAFQLGLLDEGLEEARWAVKVAPWRRLEPAVKARLLLNLGLMEYYRGNWSTAEDASRALLRLTDRLPQGLAASVHLFASALALAQDKRRSAAHQLKKAQAIAGDQPSLPFRSQILHNEALLLRARGRPRAALRLLEEARALAQEEDGHDLWRHEVESGHTYLLLRDLSQALARGVAAWDMLNRQAPSAYPLGIAEISLLFGKVSWAAGQREEAIAWLNRSASFFAQIRRMASWRQAGELLSFILAQPQTRPIQPLDASWRQKLGDISRLVSLSDSFYSLAPHLAVQLGAKVQYALSLSQTLGWKEESQEVASLVARFSDVGHFLLGIPGGPFTPLPIDPPLDHRTRAHPEAGRDFLSLFPLPAEVLEGVAAHHERWDGQGYPRGLAAEAIPPSARLVLVVDLYLALAWPFGPKPPSPHEKILEFLQKEAGRSLDPEMVAGFLHLHKIPEEGGEVP
ncbi:MAG: HD domain-containing protein [Clostridiales bacterium]|nr:HD domain-containing protein [Clostridiales bacterium]